MNPPKDLGRTKMRKGRKKHLCPSQIFGPVSGAVLGLRARIGLRGILTPFQPLQRACSGQSYPCSLGDLPMNPPKDLGRTKMRKGRKKHLCPSQIFGPLSFPVLGLKARIGLRGILTPALPMNPPKDLGRTKMRKGRKKHLCPSEIFGPLSFPVLGLKARIGFQGILTLSLSLSEGERE